MPRVHIDNNEMYPVYSIDDYDYGRDGDYTLTDADLEFVRSAFRDFYKAQRILSDVVEKKWSKLT